MQDFDGFYIGYSIQQIGKEFDLLKFTKQGILNIELKTELPPDGREEKILKQMRTNHYYLNAVSSNIIILTYVEHDGMYRYNPKNDCLCTIDPSLIAGSMKEATEDPSIVPDQIFLPANYLISPYNDTEKFLQDKYFLTTAQNAIKKEILDGYAAHTYAFYTLKASTGTGKTLLLYDIAKELIQKKQSILLFHTQALNDGQKELIHTYHWNIRSILDTSFYELFTNVAFLLIDEAQLLSLQQFSALLTEAYQKNVPVLFAYDAKPEEYFSASFDIATYIHSQYPSASLYQNKLTNKIRTNKEMAGFINAILRLSNPSAGPYPNIEVKEYQKDIDLMFYQKEQYTVLDLSAITLQQLTGQEYEKAVLIIDQDFYYIDQQLHSHTHKEELLYEIITRVISKLTILVKEDPELYEIFLHIQQSY